MDVTVTTGGVLTAEGATASRDCGLVQVRKKETRIKKKKKSAEENLKSGVQISRVRDARKRRRYFLVLSCSSDVLLNIFNFS